MMCLLLWVLFGLVLWIVINIIGAVILAVFGMDRLPQEVSRAFILLYVMLFSLWLGKKAGPAPAEA